MELNAEQIKKALECCTSTDKTANCPIGCPFGDINSCEESLMYHALALITSQEQKIKAQDVTISQLQQRCEKAEHDARRYGQKIKELTEENERLRAEVSVKKKLLDKCVDLEDIARADTVQKVGEWLREQNKKRGGAYHRLIYDFENQSAKELKGE